VSLSNRRPRLAALLLAGLAALVSPSGASASEGDVDPSGKPERWRPVQLGLLPLLDLALLEGAPFEQPGGGADGVGPLRQLARRRGEVERALHRLAATLDLVDLQGEEALRAAVARVTSLAGQGLVADERLALGRERWLGLEPAEALAQFEVAERLMLGAFVDLLAPTRYAELALWRGLALVELDRERDATAAFRTMFLHDPARRFAPGWYGTRIERLLQTAADEARAMPEAEDLRFASARLAELGAVVGATHWLTGALRPQADADGRGRAQVPLQLQLRTLRGRGTNLEAAASAVAVNVSHEAEALAAPARDVISRWLSAWHACALERETAHPLGWQQREVRRAWHLDLAYRHDVWLHHGQTRLPLHGPGVALSAIWEPQPRLQLWGRFAQVTTLVDTRGDLLAQFGATHLAAGAGLRLGGEGLSVSLRLGVAAALTLNDFEATQDIDCKFFGPDHPRCGAIFLAKAPLGWIGLETGLGLRWNPEPGWHLSALVTIDAFLGAAEAVRELNYPLAFALGFGASL
jgi:hypothetical protein